MPVEDQFFSRIEGCEIENESRCQGVEDEIECWQKIHGSVRTMRVMWPDHQYGRGKGHASP